jgi:hypothetical protein
MEREQKTEKSEANRENYERNGPFWEIKISLFKNRSKISGPGKNGQLYRVM